ncbi:hypothetical protein Xen7305DRAFT_00029290 [Xenococcus sp. PCC 7305]|uniref:hypothetical protein n=1 Tax=Xenococcus sp. PCC 7305 TaxID=102125 RepID=UPI0002ABE47B|nr:hypothetical protein [Xenococcus sp. PCC 7305]ELS03209.1 hypothetical protein Xen7305DRAFT_00029290 [Xenococcus sp. PCC 7305]
MTNNNNANGDWKTRLEQLQEEIRKATSSSQSSEETTENVYPYVEMDSETYFAKQISTWTETTRDWFKALSTPGKVIVGISAVWLGFSALNMVFHLITTLFSMAILAVILYFAYTKLIKGNG